MDNLTLEVEKLKNGFKYTVKEGNRVIDTRKSNRVYVAASVYYKPETPTDYKRPLFHGNMNLIGKGDGARFIKAGYLYKETLHNVITLWQLSN